MGWRGNQLYLGTLSGSGMALLGVNPHLGSFTANKINGFRASERRRLGWELRGWVMLLMGKGKTTGSLVD